MSWTMYLQNMITILCSLVMSERELRDIQRSLLVGIPRPHHISPTTQINARSSSSRQLTNADLPKTSMEACTGT
jgi:hypothetical protein